MTDKKEDLEQRLHEIRLRRFRERGERLKEERKRLGLSKVDFANVLGIHRNTQGNYEAGREPPVPYLLAIQELGVDIAYVMDGERLSGFPSQCAMVTERIFKTAQQLGISDLDEEALSGLAYLLAKDEQHSSSGLDDCLEEQQSNDLIRWAFKSGPEFREAFSAIGSYGTMGTDTCPSPRHEAEMILETLQLYEEKKESLHLDLHDNIRIVAEFVVNSRLLPKAPDQV